MKRMLITVLLLVLALCPSALAESESAPAPTGTPVADWSIDLSKVEPMPMPAVTPSPAVNGRMTVTGSASVRVKPDVAYVTLGVRTQAKNARDAQEKNAGEMTAIMTALSALHIAREDIRTDGFGIDSDYGTGSKIVGYTVSNTVTVTIRDMEQASVVIDAAIEAGANSVNNIWFDLLDPAPHYALALQNAMADAKVKGAAIAEAMGVSIGLPLEVIEQRDELYSPRMSMGVAYDMAGASSTPVSSGTIEISARIQAIYAY